MTAGTESTGLAYRSTRDSPGPRATAARSTAAFVAVALLAVGCGTAAPGASRPATRIPAATQAAPTQATSPPPTLSPSARRALAAAYVKIAVAGNRRLDHDFDGLEDAEKDHDLAAATANLRDVAATERLFDARLMRLTFPASSRLIVSYLAWVNQARAELSDTAARATSLHELAGYQQRLNEANVPVEQAVNIIRSRLGLPPADTH
ncbi:MAG TPA: hypothetical protein VGI74_15525 [Streptosporangiaceae bacterium]